MKKIFIAFVTIASLVACNNASETTENAKDSLDSVATERKDMIDSTAEQKENAVDSTIEQKKDALDRKDSMENENHD